MKNNFIKAIIVIAIALSFVALFTNCKKDVEEYVPPSIIGEWVTVEHFVYRPDTTIESWQYFDWEFRDNGYVIYIEDDNDTGYYVYETTPDSLFFYNANGALTDEYALTLTSSGMTWEHLIEYDPIEDFSTIRRIKLERK